MQTLVERLRAASAATWTAEYAAGRAAGRKWAEESATLAQFARLEAFFEGRPRFIDWRGVFGGENPAVFLASRLEASGYGASNETARAFFVAQGVVNSLDRSPDFFAGFAEAAISVWRSVKDRI